MNLSKYPIKIMGLIAIMSGLILPKTTTQFAITYLLILIVLDFITGIMASYIQYKDIVNAVKLRSKIVFIDKILMFFNTGAIYKIRCFEEKFKRVVSSKKLKMSGVKLLLYFSTILVTYFFEQIFFIKNFKLDFSNLSFSLTLAIILFWSAVEWHSIFFENFKKIGIDVKAIIFDLIKNFLNLKKEVDKL